MGHEVNRNGMNKHISYTVYERTLVYPTSFEISGFWNFSKNTILLNTLTVYNVARNGFQNLNYAWNSYELIMWRKVNECNARLPVFKYDI